MKKPEVRKDDPDSKESRLRLFAAIEKDTSLEESVKKFKKDMLWFELFLEVRDSLRNLSQPEE